MGTNYYYESSGGDRCEHCGRGDDAEQLHIGKSSAGWMFPLCIYPERNINSLEDWKRVWASGGQIRDEYGEFVSVDEMVFIITQRSHPSGLRYLGQDNQTRRMTPGGTTWYTTTETDFS